MLKDELVLSKEGSRRIEEHCRVLNISYSQYFDEISLFMDAAIRAVKDGGTIVALNLRTNIVFRTIEPEVLRVLQEKQKKRSKKASSLNKKPSP